MSTVRFTPDDIARIRFSSATYPAVEAFFAAELLHRLPYRPRPGSWTHYVRRRLATVPNVQAALERTVSLGGELVPLLYGNGDWEQARVVTQWPKRLHGPMEVLSEVLRSGIHRYWPSVRRLHSRAYRAARWVSAERGVAALLESTGEGVRWSSGSLFVDDGEEREVFCEGQGLVLTPSVFLTDRPRLFTWRKGDGRPPRCLLVFPVCPHGQAVNALTVDSAEVPEALCRLLGRTRAAVLASLTQGCSTLGLSRKLHISATTVSEHTSVLRSSGLITTTRASNSVRHLTTALGTTLLNATAQPQEMWCAKCEPQAGQLLGRPA